MGSPVSPIASNIFMGDHEQRAIATASPDLRPKLWLRYVDDILEIINKDNVQKLTDHINQADKSGSIKFTYEQESEGSLPFLDTLIVRKADGTIKLLVYRKPTHTDQYLNYQFHHPVHQKLGVVSTLMDKKHHILTEEEDKINEEKKVEEALKICGYPTWAFVKVKQQMQSGKQKCVTKQKGEGEKCKGIVVIPYVKGTSERMSRLYQIL